MNTSIKHFKMLLKLLRNKLKCAYNLPRDYKKEIYRWYHTVPVLIVFINKLIYGVSKLRINYLVSLFTLWRPKGFVAKLLWWIFLLRIKMSIFLSYVFFTLPVMTYFNLQETSWSYCKAKFRNQTGLNNLNSHLDDIIR